MGNLGPLLVAIIIASLVVLGTVYSPYPEAWFFHGLECTGAIGGGCL